MLVQQFAQKAFIVNRGEVLLVQKSGDDPHNPYRWEVPGGCMNFGEDVDEHLKREVREEVGLDIVPGRPFFIWQWTMTDIEPGSDKSIQVIAVARVCTAVTTVISASNREVTDYLTEARWVRASEILDLDLIPSLRPTAAAFVEDFGLGNG